MEEMDKYFVSFLRFKVSPLESAELLSISFSVSSQSEFGSEQENSDRFAKLG